MFHKRSQSGCWTCRIRRKKCDEHQPTCTSCSSRGITCHGYGPPPDWLDGGETEKKILADLQSDLKVMLRRRKDAAKWQLVQQHQTLLQHTLATTEQNELRHVPSLESLTPHPIAIYGRALLPPEVAQSSHISSTPASSCNPTQEALSFAPVLQVGCGDVGALEASMLMNYLDQVFPLQFSCYTPPVKELGRGWLLALLTRTKPLYHAALALSAFYAHSSLLSNGRQSCIERSWEMMEKHHELAFEELQFQLGDLRSCSGKGLVEVKKGIEILACTIQMISFELLRGGTDSWHIHLEAASTIVPPLMASTNIYLTPSMSLQFLAPDLSPIPVESTPMISLPEPSGNPSAGSVGQDRSYSPPAVDEIARDFLVGTFVWFDILASASTRSKPYLQEHSSYLDVCCSGDFIELDKLMGCENWVMILIAKISHLEAQKREHELAKCQNGDRSCGCNITELLERGGEIEKSLENGLRMNEESLRRFQELTLSTSSFLETLSRRDILHTTRIFAHSAIIYLHTVLLGADPSLSQISSRISVSISSFKDLSDPRLLKNLIWPLCIAGCMAQGNQESFFQALIEKAGFDTTCPGNIWKAYEIMKECWRLRRKSGCHIDWTKAMESTGLRVLLV